jgi:hypothetical protein
LKKGEREAATQWLDRMRLEFKNPHEILVAWVQDDGPGASNADGGPAGG